MASCKDCEWFEDCKRFNEEQGRSIVYPDNENNVEELCGGFEIKTEREKDMTSCKNCANGEVCGEVMEKGAEKCEGYTARNIETCKVAPSAEWQKEKEIEERILRIKAAGYDAIKKIVDESFEITSPTEETVAMIDGVLRMEEAVVKALI